MFVGLGELEPTSTIQVIPATDEKYISLSSGELVDTYTRANGVKQNVYEYMRFIDSCKFWSSSLQKTVGNLPPDKFSILDEYFKQADESSRALLKRKGFYPYSYMSNRLKFDEQNLPPFSAWGKSLKGGKINVSEDLQHAQTVFDKFNCINLEQYHNIYLTCDTLLLACVFEEFRSITHASYGLDCAHHFTASNLVGDAFMRICNADIELLSEREHLEMVENMMRDGTASVFEKRKFNAKFPYMNEKYNPQEKTSYGFMLDANNLYGGVMQMHKLPARDFELIHVKEDGEVSTSSETSLYEKLATPEDSDIGLILEVDLEYPQELHESHRDYPLAPTSEVVPKEWLSNYQRDLAEQLKSKDNYRVATGK